MVSSSFLYCIRSQPFFSPRLFPPAQVSRTPQNPTAVRPGENYAPGALRASDSTSPSGGALAYTASAEAARERGLGRNREHLPPPARVRGRDRAALRRLARARATSCPAPMRTTLTGLWDVPADSRAAPRSNSRTIPRVPGGYSFLVEGCLNLDGPPGADFCSLAMALVQAGFWGDST